MPGRNDAPLTLSADDIARWDDEADVVIAGLGCAGACAALERAALGGGTSALSGGLV